MQIQPPIINILEKSVRKAGKSFLRDFGAFWSFGEEERGGMRERRKKK